MWPRALARAREGGRAAALARLHAQSVAEPAEAVVGASLEVVSGLKLPLCSVELTSRLVKVSVRAVTTALCCRLSSSSTRSWMSCQATPTGPTPCGRSVQGSCNL